MFKARKPRALSLTRTTLLLASSFLPALVAAQVQPCTFRQDEPICNKAAFKRRSPRPKRSASTKPISTPTSPNNSQIFLTSYGKQIVPFADHPDLTFAFIFPSTEGVFVGPSGVVLARLRVYGPGASTPLLWDESYMDQPDVPALGGRSIPA